MKLTVAERIALLGMLPEQGGFATMKALTELRGNLFPTEAEVKKFGIEQTDERVSWKDNGEAEIEVSPVMKAMIVSQLTKLDGDEKLTANHLSLYEKFVEEKK